jgi:hypothetical protein
MWRCVDLVLTYVSEESITSIFRVANFASETLALAGGSRCWLHSATSQKTTLFIVTAVKASNLTSSGSSTNTSVVK